ncbi:MAG: DNA gyrase subunit A [candidate division KSB1 bacterium]|nr:DNA gyrase subunit A [candidate division KSB1 bacterium]
MQQERIYPIFIEEEMKDSYIDYSMSVIVSRALPDVRDGLKPVHRRVLFGMRELNLGPTAPYKKSARIVGEVLGKYHPHGDAAVYETLVRMAQDFSLRYPLVDGQGNFGSIDGDAPAAMRYTEARLAPIAEEVLRDLDKDTVDFVPNFDESLKEPTVLPSLLPNLLVNGAAGIAVGMATNIPPHNLREVVDALLYVVDHPAASAQELMQFIQGPDFPTGAIIVGVDGIAEAYTTGRGRIVVRARAAVEAQRGGRECIVITEIPYQVNKTSLIEGIADLVRSRKLEGISDIRDESDREGLRIVLELRREAPAKQILEYLYRHTQLQTTFGVIMLALVDGVPRILDLRQLLQHFLDFRHQVVVRRTKFELDKAEKRAHVLEGLKVALDNLDAVITLIRRSRDPETAKAGLMRQFRLSEVQAQAILDMRLQRLTSLERKKIEEEYRDVLKKIAYLKGLLASKARRMQLIKEELVELRDKYADPRRTEIIPSPEEFSIDEMIADESMVVVCTHRGFVKRIPLSSFRREMAASWPDIIPDGADDAPQEFIVASIRGQLLCFTSLGRCYALRVMDVPQGGKVAQGKLLRHLLGLAKEEVVVSCLAMDSEQSKTVILVSALGQVKRVPLSVLASQRRTGVAAMSLREGDALQAAHLSDGREHVILVTAEGRVLRFPGQGLREMGRAAAGVRGITLSTADRVVTSHLLTGEGTLCLVTAMGYGKLLKTNDIRPMNRAGKGVVGLKTSGRVGLLVAAGLVRDQGDLVVVLGDQNTVVVRSARDLRSHGRLIELKPKECVRGVSVLTIPHGVA